MGEYIELNGLRYYYEMQGQGPTLVLLHGFTGSVETWDALTPRWRETFSVIAVDLPGHGKTESPAVPERYGMEAVAKDLLALCDRLGFQTFSVMGYSMGGRLALYMAVEYASCVDRLVLESASPGLRTEQERAARCNSDAALADAIERDGIPAFVQRWEALPLFASLQKLPEAQRLHLHARRLRNNAAGLANSLRGMGTGEQPSLWAHLPVLELPVLLLVGEWDAKFTAIGQEMAALLSNAQLVEIKNSGHSLHYEQPEQVVDVVAQFLGRG